MPRPDKPWRAALLLSWLVLATPPARALLESSMTLHMLVQLPLLAALGCALGVLWRNSAAGHGIGAHAFHAVQMWNRGGATGIIAASFVMLLWMLPRGLDAARLDVAFDALKFLTVTAAGTAVALSWPRLHPIARGVVHLEVIATLLRFGWGYLAAQERLCLAYLTGDQQRAGELLLWAGVVYALVVVWRPLFGSGQANEQSRHPQEA